MKFFINKRLYAAVVLFLAILTGCEDYNNLDPDPIEPKDADFSTYVAVGNCITAGFQSNALYQSGQQFSYPNLLAGALRIQDFEQPLISDPGIGDPGRIELSNLEERTTKYNTNQGQPINTGIGRPYNNLGVPGIKIDAYLNAPDSNPFYPLIINKGSPNEPLPNIHAAVKALQPTLVSFWLGNNDILNYVTSGGLRTFTPPTDFRAQYVSAITQIQNLQSNPTVIVANIPSVATIPFATTVGPQFKDQIKGNEKVPGIVVQKTFYKDNPAINASENRAPAGLIAKQSLDNPSKALLLLTGREYLPYVGVSANPQAPSYNEQAVTAILNYWRGYIVNAGAATEAQAANFSQQQIEGRLTQITIAQYGQTFGAAAVPAFTAQYDGFDFNQPFGLSAQNPFPNQFVLDENEINITDAVTGIFNSVIAGQGDFQLDVNSIFNEIVTNGRYKDPVSGVTLQPAIGSLFSLDGIHPSNKAHAVLANKIIELLNNNTGSNIDKLNLNSIPDGTSVVSGN